MTPQVMRVRRKERGEGASVYGLSPTPQSLAGRHAAGGSPSLVHMDVGPDRHVIYTWESSDWAPG